MYYNYNPLIFILIALLFITVIVLIILVIILFMKQGEFRNEILSVKRAINKLTLTYRPETPPTSKTKDIPQSEKVTVSLLSPIEAEPSKKERNYESWFGRNVVGLAAAVLVFVGLIFLGILIYKYIPEIGKIILMYLISSIILFLGLFLMRKFKNIFPHILTGCGLGCFFISILLTHIYFHKFSDLVAFSLLLVWLIISLVISKIHSSLMISIVAHIGVVISMCFAYTLGLTDEKLVILMGYQIASIVIIILGNILCSRQTYRFGLFISLIMTIVSGTFMWNKFILGVYFPTGTEKFSTSLPIAGIATAFFLQFFCAAFISYLLAVSANHVKNKTYSVLIHLANKLMFIWILFINVYHVVYRLSFSNFDNTTYTDASAIFWAVTVCMAILIIHGIITILMSIKFNFSSYLENCSIIILTVFSCVFLYILWFTHIVTQANPLPFNLTGFVIITLLLMLGYYLSKNNALKLAAYLVLGLDLIFMIFSGYKELNSLGKIWLPVLYLAVISVLVFLQWMFSTYEFRTKYAVLYKILMYITAEFSLISIFVSADLNNGRVLSLLVLTTLNIVLYFIRFDSKEGQGSLLYIFMHINEVILLLFCISSINGTTRDVDQIILSLILTLFISILSFMRIGQIISKKQNAWMYIWTGLKFTLIVLSLINGITDWFNYVYIFSIVSMLSALACVCFGFFIKAKSLRLYGLIITLIFVIKLVTYDVSGENTILRVSALIGGGIICFIISAIYAYTEKRLNKNENN